MSQTLSSAYAGLAKLLTDAGHFITPAELQGALWGRVAAGADPKVTQALQDLSVFLDEGELTAAIVQAITGLQEMINKEFSDGSVTITLLLPIDDDPLDERLKALINWGNGFLSGFGLIKQADQLPKEALEILADIDAITQLEIKISPEDEARSEGDYMELTEFFKVAPLLVATELKSYPEKEQTIH